MENVNPHNRTLVQEKRRISFVLNSIKPSSLVAVDEWLQEVLGVPVIGIDDKATRKKDSPDRLTYALAMRILLLVRSFMQALKLPFFDLGDIVKITKTSKSALSWNVVVIVPAIDNVWDGLYQFVFSYAIKVVFFCEKTPKTPANRASLHEAIDKQLLQHLRGFTRGG